MSAPSPITSPLLLAEGFAHGFFTRKGGCSSGCFESLNCSFSVGDDERNVRENLTRVGTALALQPNHLVTVSQVHGSKVLQHRAEDTLSELSSREADALIGSNSQYGLTVRTADCVPILLGCRKSGMAAAIHAGWKGLVAQVIQKTVEALVKNGSAPDAIIAAIGPHIGVEAFEVSDEVASQLDAVAFGAEVVNRRPGAKPHVSLVAISMAQLVHAGLAKSQVTAVSPCTYSNEQDFFSYRRNGMASGRQVSVIVPRSPSP